MPFIPFLQFKSAVPRTFCTTSCSLNHAKVQLSHNDLTVQKPLFCLTRGEFNNKSVFKLT